MNRSAILLLATLLCASSASASSPWQKYVSEDESFSFHYPAGWKLNAGESIIEVTNPPADEQLLVVAVPFDEAKSAKQLAQGMLSLFRRDMPDLEPSGWVVPESAPNMVLFDVGYSDKGKRYLGMVMVMKAEGSAHWFSYSSPATAYSKAHAAGLLQKVLSTVVSGPGSKPPLVDEAPVGKPAELSPQAERNARGFLFAVEFALGAPFTQSQEDAILGELRRGWSARSAEELARFDDYPKLVEAILMLEQKSLEVVRADLEGTIREWLAESDASDPAVAAIKAQLGRGAKVVVQGEPALTELAATAYAELMAFSRLLHRNPKARPDQLDGDDIAAVRKELLQAWSGFSKQDRTSVTGAPGLWFTLRTLLERGSKADQSKVRAQLKKLTRPKATAKSATASGSRDGQPMSWAAHQSLMAVQQQTFNTYMWSRGYSGWTPMGKF